MAEFNLVIVHTPRRQQRSDFMTIRNIMAGRAPEIDVHVVSIGTSVAAGFWKRMAELPTLLFSPMPVSVSGQTRGAQLVSVALSKFEEIEHLSRAGIPVPETCLITRETQLDERTWGPLTILKPNWGYRGSGVRLMRTRDVRWRDTSALPAGDPHRGRNLLAQRFVDTGPHAASHRVMTVLGQPVYSIVSRAIEKRPPLDPSGTGALDMEIAANNVARDVALSDDIEVIDLARSVHAKFPDVPVMGIDIVREQDSGRLFVLEFNSPGSTWHLSSEHGLEYQRRFKLDLYGQFNALSTIADALIEATRKKAV